MNVAASKKRWSKKSALALEPTWSEYQQAIFDWVEHGHGNLQIGAVAGSGKSTVLAAIVARLPADAKIQILAFNRHIVESLKNGQHADGTPKLPSRVSITTAHGLGNSLLTRHLLAPCYVDGNKYRAIARPLIAALPVSLPPSMDGKAKKEKTALMRREWMQFAMALIRGVQSTLCATNPQRLSQLIKYYGIEKPQNHADAIIDIIPQILNKGEALARNDLTIDFGDMLYLPHVWGLQPSEKDWVLIDEVQDANRAQLALYEKLAKNARVIAVGDADQAIQGFAFASPKMWAEVGRRFDAESLPLSVCYRCPQWHLDLARYFVPAIQAAPQAQQGHIETLHPLAVPAIVQPGDLIVCRFTAPLVSMAIDLIIKGIPAKVRGRDIGINLARIADVGESNWDDFVGVMTRIIAEQIDKAKADEKLERVDALNDELDCILGIHRHYAKGCKNLAAFLRKIEDLFSDDASPVTLSTIHRSKGDEADRVFILKCNALPYQREGMQEWQLQQENNLAYVALTRAKSSLYFVPIGDDAHDTARLAKYPYGGMAVSPVAYEAPPTPDPIPAPPTSSAPSCLPIGTVFNDLCGATFRITSATFDTQFKQWQYQAEHVGEDDVYWQAQYYTEATISRIISTPAID